MRLREARELAGYFWVAEHPEDRLAGTLRVDQSGSSILETLGNFGGIKSLNSDSPLSRIFGVVEQGAITLENCFYKNKNFGFGRAVKSTILVNRVVLGACIEAEGELTYSRIALSIQGLDEWLGAKGPQTQIVEGNKVVAIHYSRPEAFVMQVAPDLKVELWADFALSHTPQSAAITQTSAVVLRPSTPLTLDQLSPYIRRINTFLSFAIDSTVSIEAISAYSPSVTYTFEGGAEKEIHLELFYPSIPSTEAPSSARLGRMMFNFAAVKSEMPSMLSLWLANYERFSPSFNLFFAAKEGAHSYLEGSFLSLAQAIETLHRRISSATVMGPAAFEDLVKSIVASCPVENQKWLAGRIRHGNEPTLKSRLEEMIEPFAELFGDEEKRDSLLWKITNTRNYLTHFDKSLEAGAAKGLKLYALITKLEALIQLHLLRLIGLSTEQIVTLAKQSDRGLSYNLGYEATS